MPDSFSSPSPADLQDRSWDLLAEMWTDQEADILEQQLQQAEAEGNTAEMDAFFEEYDARNLQLIQRNTQRQWRHHLLHTTFPRILRTAAAVIAVLTLVGGAAVAASSTVRKYLSKLIVEQGPEFTIFTVDEDSEQPVDVPAGWEGSFFPTRIPEGLVIRDVFPHDVSYSFPDSPQWQLIYSEVDQGSTVMMDTEGGISEPFSFFGHEGALITYPDEYDVWWFDGQTLFRFMTRGFTKEEALACANSLRRIK